MDNRASNLLEILENLDTDAVYTTLREQPTSLLASLQELTDDGCWPKTHPVYRAIREVLTDRWEASHNQ